MIIKATKKPETIECVKWDGENSEEIANGQIMKSGLHKKMANLLQ